MTPFRFCIRWYMIDTRSCLPNMYFLGKTRNGKRKYKVIAQLRGAELLSTCLLPLPQNCCSIIDSVFYVGYRNCYTVDIVFPYWALLDHPIGPCCVASVWLKVVCSLSI